LKIKLPVILKSILCLLFFISLSSNASGADCFSDSPSTEAGRDMYEETVPRELEEGEFEALEELLGDLDGRWEGTAEVTLCGGTSEDPKEETDEYSISSKATMSRSGDFSLNSTLNSRAKRTKQDEKIRLYLSKKMLTTQGNMSVSDLELIAVSSDELIYLRKTTSGNPVKRAVEHLTAILKSSETSFVVENQVFVQGQLKSVSIWNLEKN